MVNAVPPPSTRPSAKLPPSARARSRSRRRPWQRIDSGAQLANQLGPAMLRDLAALQLQNKNQKIADLLKKYGVEARAEQAPAKPASTPATPATPADKKP